MDDPKKDQEEMSILEAQDGSATVDLPENMIQSDGVEENNDVQGQSSSNEEASIDQNESQDVSHDDEDLREAKRSRRRAKKDLILKTNQEKELRLQQLQRENEEFKRRLYELERNTKSEQLVRIDKGIEDANVRLEYAKMKLAEATQSQDGQAMVEAQTLWQNASKEVDALTVLKARAEEQLRNPQQVQMPDANVQWLAAQWMRRNAWYNPAGNDADTRVAKKVDELMVTQGWNPSDPDYWDELDSRLQKELPHRYNDLNDYDSKGVKRPRNVVGSSGREASAAYGGVNRTQFVLSPDRVRAMKEAGAWDNPERKARMIKQFIAYDRTNGVRN